MNSMLRVMAACNRVKPGNPTACTDSAEALLLDAAASSPDLVLLPACALSSASCGDLFSSGELLDAASDQLDRLCSISAELSCFVVAGLPLSECGGAVSAAAVLHRGKLIGLLPDHDPPYGMQNTYSERFLPPDTVFSCGSLRFAVCPGNPERLLTRAAALQRTGFDLLLVPARAPVTAGSTQRCLEAARMVSRSLGCAVAVANGGVGESSSPHLYRGFAAVFECGRELGAKIAGREEISLLCDLDADVIHSQKTFHDYKPVFFSAAADGEKRGLLRPLPTDPFLPPEGLAREAYLDELFELQVRSLCGRMENARIRKLVLGLSGGLDSTLALLVGAAALDALSLPRENLIGVTMPGFGTSDRTYFNALGLLEALGVTSRDISIRAAVTQHFEDIGHDPAVRDITYENAQARERTQILFDLANEQGGLVLGTGDLSEAALGWCTFGGDQLAGYNVNICIPKTVVRLIVERRAARGGEEEEFLRDVLATPVSPELLPAAESGEIAQKTEEIIGPYELHDYFLYHMLRYRFRPAKLYYYSCAAFAGRYQPGYLREKLILFLRRFVSGQFKRSCSPDSARLTDVSLHSAAYRIPSDLDPAVLIGELETITF